MRNSSRCQNYQTNLFSVINLPEVLQGDADGDFLQSHVDPSYSLELTCCVGHVNVLLLSLEIVPFGFL